MKTAVQHAIVFSVALLTFGGLALAQEGPGPGQPRQRLRERVAVDSEKSPQAAANPARPALDRIFNALDADGDGKIDKREMAEKGRGLLERLRAQGTPPAAPDKQARPGSDKKRPEQAKDKALRRQGRGPGQGHPGLQRRGFAARRGEAGANRFRGQMQRRGGQERPGPWGPMAGRGFGRGPSPAPGDAPAFQPFAAPGRMNRGPQGFGPDRPAMAQPERPALHMLDSNNDGRLDAPEIRSKIEVLERLLRQAEREPIDLRMPGPMGPSRP